MPSYIFFVLEVNFSYIFIFVGCTRDLAPHFSVKILAFSNKILSFTCNHETYIYMDIFIHMYIVIINL